jgi:hypothetical protein
MLSPKNALNVKIWICFGFSTLSDNIILWNGADFSENENGFIEN